MKSRGKILYQVKLILDCLPPEEYKLIPQKTIDYIEENFENDPNITIDPNIPLEKQKIFDETYDMLDKIVKEAEINKKKKEKEEKKQYNQSVRESNKEYDEKNEIIELKKIIEILKKENSKIPRAKNLCEEYKFALKQKDEELINLRKSNEELCEKINKIPIFIKRIFIKEKNKK